MGFVNCTRTRPVPVPVPFPFPLRRSDYLSSQHCISHSSNKWMNGLQYHGAVGSGLWAMRPRSSSDGSSGLFPVVRSGLWSRTNSQMHPSNLSSFHHGKDNRPGGCLGGVLTEVKTRRRRRRRSDRRGHASGGKRRFFVFFW